MTQDVTQDQPSISVMEKEAASLDYVYEASGYGYYLKIRHHIENCISSCSTKVSKSTTSSAVEIKSHV